MRLHGLIAFVVLSLVPVQSLARGRRPGNVVIVDPGKIHGKRKHKFKTVGRCLKPDGKTWARGCK